jgi:hypothetical protein
MNDRFKLINDIKEKLGFDETEFSKGLYNFILNDATVSEIELMLAIWITLEDNEYNTVEEFIEEYQPVFDVAEIDLKDQYSVAVRRKEARTLNYDNL